MRRHRAREVAAHDLASLRPTSEALLQPPHHFRDQHRVDRHDKSGQHVDAEHDADQRCSIAAHHACQQRDDHLVEVLLEQKQQLARLRLDDLVTTRRDGKTIYYSLADANTLKFVKVIYEMFCSGPEAEKGRS